MALSPLHLEVGLFDLLHEIERVFRAQSVKTHRQLSQLLTRNHQVPENSHDLRTLILKRNIYLEHPNIPAEERSVLEAVSPQTRQTDYVLRERMTSLQTLSVPSPIRGDRSDKAIMHEEGVESKPVDTSRDGEIFKAIAQQHCCSLVALIAASPWVVLGRKGEDALKNLVWEREECLLDSRRTLVAGRKQSEAAVAAGPRWIATCQKSATCSHCSR